MIQKKPKIFLYLLGALFLINLIQSYFTELIFDESYYWYYAQNLDWGYFDHPPMVALLIKLSSFLFNGELGVRFMSALFSVLLFAVIWDSIDAPEKNKYVPHFFVLGFSMTLLNAYGFLTLPDTPLLFFTALFLWVYKKFIAAPEITLSLALGLVMACLMYSKYHAVLVIIFVLLSNVKLITNKYAWLAVLIALLAYTPHFIWLYHNNFVSILYHLIERPNRAYEFFDFTAGFFINMLALFGLTFPLVYYVLYKTKTTDTFTRALLFLTYGVLLFFFISSFNRRIQTQWIIVICIPIFILVFNYMLESGTIRKWIYRLGLINIVLLLYARFWLVFPSLLPLVYESHGNKEWVSELQSQIGNIPVVFENSYRNAPMYAFYSGSDTYSLNTIRYRQNQYTIDDSESKVQQQKVLYFPKTNKPKKEVSYSNAKGDIFYGTYIDNFESFRKLACSLDPKPITLDYDNQITLKVYNPYAQDIALTKISFGLAYLNNYKQVREVVSLDVHLKNASLTSLISRDTTYFTFKLPTPKKINTPGYFKIGISENGLYLGLNGKTTTIQ